IYVEPDPAPDVSAVPDADWNAIRTAQAAVLSIPRVETIRADIQAVLDRNRTIERAREIITLAATDSAALARAVAVIEEPAPEDWAALSLDETIESYGWGASYGTYHRLKVRGLVDYLAGLGARAGGLDPESEDLIAVRALVRAWKNRHFSEAGGGGKL